MFTFHTHDSNAIRRARKKLGEWSTPWAKAVWTTKEGKKIKVRDMGDNHLINTMRLLIRKAANRKLHDDSIFLNGPFPKGEMAEIAFEEDACDQWDTDIMQYVQDIYWDMEREFEHRGLLENLVDYIQTVNEHIMRLELKRLCQTLS